MHICFFDGASQGNPGPSGAGAVIISPDGEVIWEKAIFLGTKTNNEAEYMALILLLEELNRQKIGDCIIHGDSQLVVNQVVGEWQVNKPHLYSLCQRAISLFSSKYRLAWIPREKNKVADKLSKAAIDLRAKSKTNDRLYQMSPRQVEESIFVVKSSKGNKHYAVDLENEACTCPAFVNNRTRPCKHILGVGQHIQASSKNIS